MVLHSVNTLEFYLRISSKTSMFLTKLKSRVFSNAHFSLVERLPIEIARPCKERPLSATLKWRKQAGLRVLRRAKSQKSWAYLNERKKNIYDNNTSARRRSQRFRTP